MALRNIVKDGDPLLKKKSRSVTNFDERLAVLIDDMIDTMRSADGVGLAAVQAGVLRRVIVIEWGENLIELVNPEVLETGEETACGTEGCLSFPEQQGIVRRPTKIKVKGKNRSGEEAEYEAEGFLARIFCHELDHLEGTVFLDVALSDEEVEEYLKEHTLADRHDDNDIDEDFDSEENGE